MIVRTDLEWSYDPADYFEVRLRLPLAGATAAFDDGMVTVTLDAPTPDLTPGLRSALADAVEDVLLTRQILTHRPYQLSRPTVVQYGADGGRRVSVEISGAATATSIGRVDVSVMNSSGEVVHDTRAERLARDEAFVATLVPKLARSPVLRALVRSYDQAVRDPGDELVHLYEIRDALARHYGGDEKARRALYRAGVTKTEWSRLGQLACTLPLAQGRHRGEHVGALRPATTEELQEARDLARKLVEAFAGDV